MQFRLLGALEVRDDHDRVLSISGRQQRALLAVLLLNVNHLVPTEHLIPALWASREPSGARHSLHLLVHRLRRALTAGGVDALHTEGAGYVLRAVPDQVDALRFEALSADARAAGAAGAHEEALAGYDAALALWRGRALAEFREAPFARPAIARLEELYVAARTGRAETALALGGHAEVVPSLEELVHRYPLQERIRYLLILALYRSGRQADALAAYQSARQELVDRLGIEPGPELQELERAILKQDPALAPPEPTRARPSATPAAPVPPAARPASGAAPADVAAPARAAGGRAAVAVTERRVVTVLAVRFEPGDVWHGRGEPGGRPDPEELWVHRRLVVDVLRQRVERAGGVVLAEVGQTVVASFGAARAQRDDAARAVRTALEVVRALQESGGGTVAAGVDTGEAIVTLTGVGLPPQVTGEAYDAAVDLAAAAPGGVVLAGPAACRATEQAVEYRRFEQAGAHGTACQAVRADRQVPAGGATPVLVVGRDRELALLAELQDRSRDEPNPYPQLVTVVGAPGIGKTRLIAELRRLTEEESSGRWLEGRSLPYGDGVTYWALAEIVKLSAGIQTADSAADAEGKLRAAADGAFGDTAQGGWTAEYLTRLVHPRAGADEDAGWQREAFRVWRSYLEALALERPLVVVFEDLHWADDDLLDFVEHLADHPTPVPLLVVCVAWPELLERRPDWGGGQPSVTTLSLGPLSGRHTGLLLDALLNTAGSKVDLDGLQRAQVLDGAGGNPLFVEEYVRMLRATEAAGAAPEEITPPETLQMLIAARVDGLRADDRALLVDAAVLGETVRPDALAAVSGRDPGEVEAGVARLIGREFLRPVRPASGPGESSPGRTAYAFRHVLIQQVSYGRLLRCDRAVRHRRAAEWLEALGDRAEDNAELIAHHWREAAAAARTAEVSTGDLEERAAAALRRAGDRAGGLAAYGAAARYYGQALELWPASLPGRLELILAREELRVDLDFDGDAGLLREAHDGLVAAGDPVGAAMAQCLLARAAWVRGQAVGQHQDRALSLLRPAPPSERKARVLAHLTHSLSLSSRHAAAVDAGREADELAGSYGLRRLQAQARGFTGTSRAACGDASGITAARAAVETLAKLSSALAPTLSGMCTAARSHVGDLRGWTEQLDRSLALSERFGAAGYAMWLTMARTGSLYPAGRWDEAQALADRSIAQLQGAAGTELLETVCRSVRGKIRLARGDVDGALADGSTAFALTRDADGIGFLIGAALHGYTLLAAGGSHAELERLAAQAIGQLPGAILLPHVGVELAEVLAAAGRGPDVVDDTLANGSLWLQAMRAVLDGRHDRAAAIYERMGAHADEALARLRAAQRLTVAGRAAEATEHATRARAFYEKVGATYYLRQLEALDRG